LAAYIEAVETGQQPHRHEWLARYPDLADELTVFLDNRDLIESLIGPRFANKP